MGKFVIKKQSNDEFMFNLVSGSNTILTSEGYKNKSGCLNGIESVKVNSQIADRFVRKISTDNAPFFVLESKQGEQIGKSETYDSDLGMELGIQAVKKLAPAATTEDRTL